MQFVKRLSHPPRFISDRKEIFWKKKKKTVKWLKSKIRFWPIQIYWKLKIWMWRVLKSRPFRSFTIKIHPLKKRLTICLSKQTGPIGTVWICWFFPTGVWMKTMWLFRHCWPFQRWNIILYGRKNGQRWPWSLRVRSREKFIILPHCLVMALRPSTHIWRRNLSKSWSIPICWIRITMRLSMIIMTLCSTAL